MLTPMTEREQALTIKNVVAACKDITKLNKRGYNFLYLCSGFIAHYNLYGFINTYQYQSLKDAILRNVHNNQWSNFRPGEENYDYYKAKAKVYNEIVNQIS